MAKTTSAAGKMATPPVARLRESRLDRAASMIVALLVLVGVVVSGLFVAWFALRSGMPRWATTASSAAPVRMEHDGGDPKGAIGDKLNLEGPERDEIGQNSDVLEPGLQHTMQIVVDAAAKQTDEVDSKLVANTNQGTDSRGGGRLGNSKRPGPGDGRGPGGGGPAWEMQYDESTLTAYAQPLDSFKIELAVIGGSKDGIEYAHDFGQGTPARRTGTRNQEQSLDPRRTYFTHTSGTVEKYDRQLLAKAGLNSDGFGQIILQYYPRAAEAQLLAAQQQYQGLKERAIKKTVFGIRRARDGGFEFYVVHQVRR